MPSSKLTSKGQITLPIEVRRSLGLRTGDLVSFRTTRDGTVLVEAETVDLLSLKGSIKSKTKGISIEDMQRAISRGARK